jgi:hypothetical protein
MFNPFPFLTKPGVFGRENSDEEDKTGNGNNAYYNSFIRYFEHI